MGYLFSQDRKPFVLKHAMIAYNLYQVIYNTWCCYGFVREVSGQGYANKMNIWGNHVGDIGNTFGLGTYSIDDTTLSFSFFPRLEDIGSN